MLYFLFLDCNLGGIIMSSCPKCGYTHCIKDGIVKGKQRYQCKSCRYRHTVNHIGKNPETKRQALELYLEGLGFRSIGRFLKCSHVTVFNWIKSYGSAVHELRSQSDIKVIELDELHTFIGSKKTIAGYGLLLIDMGKDFSTAYWVPAEQKLGKNSGSMSQKTTSNML